MTAAGAITGILVSKDQARFDLMQTMVTFLLVVLVLFVIAFWPARWSHGFGSSLRIRGN